MPEGEGLIIGLDIGGTKVAAGLVNSRGEILFRNRTPMVSRKDAAAGLHAVVMALESVLAAEPAQGACLSAIGISCPGPLDPKRGVVIQSSQSSVLAQPPAHRQDSGGL